MQRKSVCHVFPFFTLISKQRWLQLFIASCIWRNTFLQTRSWVLLPPLTFHYLAGASSRYLRSWWVLLKNSCNYIAFVSFPFMSSSICVAGSVSDSLSFLSISAWLLFGFLCLPHFLYLSISGIVFLASFFFFFLPFSSLFFLPQFQLLQVKTRSLPPMHTHSCPHRPVPSLLQSTPPPGPWSHCGCSGELSRAAGSSSKNKLRLKPDLIYLTKSTELLWGYFVITKVLFVFKFAVYPLCIYFTYLGSRSLGKLNSMYESPRFHKVPEKHF